MSMRTALRQTRWVTFGVLAAVVWTLLITFEVATAFDWTAFSPGAFVGQTAVGGIAGVAVLVLLLGLLVVLYSELTETDPAPQAWPPE